MERNSGPGRTPWLVAADPAGDPARPGPEVAADGSGAAAAVALDPARKPGGTGSPALTRRISWLLGLMRSKVVRFGFLALALALLGLALVDESNSLWHQVERLSVPIVLLALALNYCGLICSLMVWRELLADLGSRLTVPEAWRIMFIGQLAKYIPGSLWPILAQAELGADRGIPRSRSALSVLLSYAVMTLSGAVVAAVTLPFATAASILQYIWVVALVPVAIVLLSPPVLNRMLALVLRLTHRGPLEQGVSYRGLARTMGWAVAGWLCNGIMVYVLMRQLSGQQQGTLLVSIGAYALSWAVGFLAIVAPAGVGVREAVMVAVLHTRTTTAIALTIALLTRATAVVCDAVAGGVAGALVGRGRLRRLRAARNSADPDSGER